MKQIISFSLWGNVPMHVAGAFENIKLAKEYYPDWICRFYTDNSVPVEVMIKLVNEGAEVYSILGNRGSFWGMFWRFFANDDPEVERFISRDCDSRINIREKVAVDEWIQSGKSLHTMHDHYFHKAVPILGGMWGLKTGAIQDMTGKINAWGHYDRKGCDQIFLRNVIWPLLRDDVLRHDNGHEMVYGPSNKFPPHPPMKFNGTFIGEIFDENNVAMNPVPWNDPRMLHYDGDLIT